MRTLIDKLSSQITISYEEFELAKSKMKKLDRKTVDQIDQIQTLMKFQNNQIAKTKSMCQLNIEKLNRDFLRFLIIGTDFFTLIEEISKHGEYKKFFRWILDKKSKIYE